MIGCEPFVSVIGRAGLGKLAAGKLAAIALTGDVHAVMIEYTYILVLVVYYYA